MMRGLLILGLTALGASASCASRDQGDTVQLHGGAFRMGTAETTIPQLRTRYAVNFPGSFENEIPLHQVTISSVRMDRHEVTNARFAVFVAAHAEWGPGRLSADRQNGRYLADWSSGSYPDGKDRHPVAFVTWHAAQAFCRWAGGRLPTESEWEYAARAGDQREFPWGDDLPAPDRANYGASGHKATVAVGSYPPNPWGLYDLAGNAWEWMLDEWTPTYPPGPVADPVAGGLVPDQAIGGIRGRRIIRGGSYGGAVVNLRTRWRDSHETTNATDFVGFRCAYPDGRE